MTDPEIVVRPADSDSGVVADDDEPSGRAGTGVISRARSADALISASAARASSAAFFAAATATGSVSESRLRLRVTMGIGAGATGSSLATGAGASSGGTGTPLRATGGSGELTTAGSAESVSEDVGISSALVGLGFSDFVACAGSVFGKDLEMTLD